MKTKATDLSLIIFNLTTSLINLLILFLSTALLNFLDDTAKTNPEEEFITLANTTPLDTDLPVLNSLSISDLFFNINSFFIMQQI
jgi:hypothetical protein